MRKLGFNNKETEEVSKEFFSTMNKTLGKYVNSKEEQEFLSEIIKNGNEPIYENLRPLVPHRPAPPISTKTQLENNNGGQNKINKIQRPTEAPPLPPTAFHQEIIKMKSNLRKVEPNTGQVTGMGKPSLVVLQKEQIKAINEQLKNLEQKQTNQQEQEPELDK